MVCSLTFRGSTCMTGCRRNRQMNTNQTSSIWQGSKNENFAGFKEGENLKSSVVLVALVLVHRPELHPRLKFLSER